MNLSLITIYCKAGIAGKADIGRNNLRKKLKKKCSLIKLHSHIHTPI